MATNPKKIEESVREESNVLKVKTSTVVGSTYAQIVGVVVTDTDLTLEFVYKSPRPEIKEAEVVSRVTLPRVVGESLVKAINDTVAQHEAKKKGKEHAAN